MSPSSFVYRSSISSFARVAATLGAAFVLGSCGGGGGGGSSTPAAPAPVSTATPDQLANICTNAGEKAWVAAHLNDVYLFYKDIVPVDPNSVATPEDYFNALLVKSKDRFSFVESQTAADGFFNAGQNVTFGGTFKFDTTSRLRVVFVDANGPLAAQNVTRGAQIVSLNGTPVLSLSNAQLNALLFPTAVGANVTFSIIDEGQTVARTVVVSAANIVEDPVPIVHTVLVDPTNPASAPVGYMLFNAHVAIAESELISGFASFKAAGVQDVVLDLRYNGGGFLYIADDIASMVGGNRVPPNTIFDKLIFNDKHPEQTNDPNNTIRFTTVSSTGQTMPQLNLPRVFVLTSPSTCSASETIINGLAPFVNVIRVGGTTCGKPYADIQTNNCGDAFFAIRIQSTNAVGFGDYASGFAPTCAADDDFDHALGDPNEGRLATALAFARTGSCPTTPITHATTRVGTERESILERLDRQRLLLRQSPT